MQYLVTEGLKRRNRKSTGIAIFSTDFLFQKKGRSLRRTGLEVPVLNELFENLSSVLE